MVSLKHCVAGLVLSLQLPSVSANGIHDAQGNIIEGLAPEELAMATSGRLGDRTPSIAYWSDVPAETRGAPPYVPPSRYALHPHCTTEAVPLL
jgi:hypothetical protein